MWISLHILKTQKICYFWCLKSDIYWLLFFFAQPQPFGCNWKEEDMGSNQSQVAKNTTGERERESERDLSLSFICLLLILFLSSIIFFLFLSLLLSSWHNFLFFWYSLIEDKTFRVCLIGEKRRIKEWDGKISERILYSWLFDIRDKRNEEIRKGF